MTGNGGNATYGTGGLSFTNGCTGGNNGSYQQCNGGFGGGGGTHGNTAGGGGGGGYSGGAGGWHNPLITQVVVAVTLIQVAIKRTQQVLIQVWVQL